MEQQAQIVAGLAGSSFIGDQLRTQAVGEETQSDTMVGIPHESFGFFGPVLQGPHRVVGLGSEGPQSKKHFMS